MRTTIIDTKKSVVRDLRASISIDAFILLAFFIIGLLGFLVSFQSKSFDRFLIAGIVVIAVKEILTAMDRTEYDKLRKKVMNISVSAGLITFKTTSNSSLLFDNREVLDGPIFKITKNLNYTTVEVIPDGCKNSEKIYELSHRIEEQFHKTAELKDNRFSAIYVLRDEPKMGRKLSRDDFR